MKPTLKAHLAVLITNLIFGINYSIIKIVSPSKILPLGLNMARTIVACVLFWCIYLIKPSAGRIGIDKKDVKRFILCAASGVVINQIFFVKGLSMTSPIHASLLSLIAPIAIVLIAAKISNERLSLRVILGLMMGIAGAVILIMSKNNSDNKSNMLLGDLYVLINAVFYAFFMIWVKDLMHKYKPVHVIRWVFTFGLFMMLPFGFSDMMNTQWSLFNTTDWMAVGMVCIGATFISYLFNVYGISVIGSAATGTYIYTQPFFAAVIAILFMGETLTIYKVAAAILILFGVYMVNKKRVL